MIIKENNNIDYVSQLSLNAKKIIDDLRKVCIELGSLIKSHTEILNYTDVKLYQIAYKANDDDYSEYFDWFCDDQWQMFSEWLDENNLIYDNVRGSNSKFYIRDGSDNVINSILNEWSTSKDVKDLININSDILIGQDFVYYWYNESYIYSPNTLGLISHITNKIELNAFIDDIFEFIGDYDMNDIEDIISDISDIASDIEKDVIPTIKNIIKGYKYLNDLKKNELQIWDDFVAFAKEQDIY